MLFSESKGVRKYVGRSQSDRKFVLFELRFYEPVMSSMASLPNHTFPGQEEVEYTL